MENVPELLRIAEYAEFKQAGRGARLPTSTAEILNAADYGVPQRRRRAIVDRHPRGGAMAALAATQTHGDPEDGCRSAARSVALTVPGRGRRAAAAAGRATSGTSAAEPAAGERAPLQGGAARRRRPLRRCSGTSTAPGSAHLVPRVLAEQADRHDRRLRPALVGPPRAHDPDRVLQAGEGPLPPPDRAPPDHRPRGARAACPSPTTSSCPRTRR